MSIHKQTNYSKILLWLAALCASLFVVACSSKIDLSSGSCPSPAILADTETFAALDIDNNKPLWTAQLGGMMLECELNWKKGHVKAQFLFAGTIHFAEDTIREENQKLYLPIFVLFLTPDDEIVARRDIVVEVKQAAFGEIEFVYEIEDINVPTENYPPNMYQVLIGFQLDPAQIAFNRKARRQKLNL
ncbi:MAG: hypothetical protein OXU76_03740 [Alphaproteobacteria bacterium]|nr:hypothetical protein [Alphaproteobacteria bacterium]